MLWLALYCPTLALDCFLRRWPAGIEPAIAVTEVDGSRRFIVAATRTAQACGVFPGQSVSTAVALLPDLVVVARNPEDERRALTDAALAALRFTPTVSLRASGLVMEVSASLRLFDGRRALKRSLSNAMRTQGLGIAIGEAPTPHGAWLLAKQKASRRSQNVDATLRQSPDEQIPAPTRPACGATTFDAALDAVPIGLLESLESTGYKMAGIGVHKLEDLRRLPTSGLANRFGHELIDELARARGDKPDPQAVFEAPSSFESRIELMAQVDNAAALVFASQRLLEQMCGWLKARRAAVRDFSLELHHERWRRDAIEPTIVPIAVATPSSDHRRLLGLIRERMSRLELKSPVLELSIAAPTIIEEQEKAAALFLEHDKTTETLARLLEKLIARLGEKATCRIAQGTDQRLERSWREELGAAQDEITSGNSTTSMKTIEKQQRSETWILDETDTCDNVGSIGSQKIGDDSGLVEANINISAACGNRIWNIYLNVGRPVWLLLQSHSLGTQKDHPSYASLPLALLEGPERIETGWWNNISKERDYFIAQNKTGHLVWIYREHLLKLKKPLWYLQGLFA